ncbi:MAG: M20/M25/M40 family metallo-hydrolase [Clostridia bacterium]|nr:M20/M25/M40 family metallo-hydrolase [Clostridia bacterium]
MDIQQAFFEIDSLSPRYTDLLEELCAIEGTAYDKREIDRLIDCVERFAQKEGLSCRRTPFAACGDFLTVEMNVGAEKGGVMLAHTDTVHKIGSFGLPAVRREGDRLMDPGAVDCKGGIAVALLVLKALLDNGYSRHARLLLTSDEEISNVLGGVEEQKFFRREVSGFPCSLNCETTEGNDVVVARRGILHYELTVKGRGGHAGIGHNLDEAAAPRYLDTKNGRVALVAVTCESEGRFIIVGKQSRRYPGRPGVNALRVEGHLQVTAEQLAVVREIADASKINAQKEIERAEGYHPPLADGVAVLRDLEFFVGDKTAYIPHPNAEDMARVEKAIYEAEMQADYILISVHSHELSGDRKENPSDFLIEFAHRCIDAGAHAVIGHGPHLLRPMEIYKSRPIFYSLGDFVIHNECIPYAPEEMFEAQGLTSDATMRELFCRRSKSYTRGLMRDRRMLESVVPYFEMQDGRLLHLEIMPVELCFDKPVWRSGNPRFSCDHGIIERFTTMSREFGAQIEIDERGFGIVKLS